MCDEISWLPGDAAYFFYFGKVRTVLNYFFRSVICIEISGTTHLSEQFLYGRNGILIFTGD